ncbi:MAG TPA: MATE family efflux transporter [Rhizomicrobium sp.]|jgi:MATE family multidrug resistance protein|nr:MATE family efflux transporter [Rhizomicrobium sp.]
MTDVTQMDFTEPGPRIAGRRHGAWLLEARELLRLALPLAATQLAQMAILATDTLMLGHLSPTALAAAALGNTVFFFTWLLGTGPANAVSALVAHAVGERRAHHAGVRAATRMGLWSAALMTPPLLLLLVFTRPILLFFGQQPALAADAGRYMSALCLALPFALTFQVLRNFATSVSRPAAPMIVMGLAVLFNAAGDYALIFGHFGLPRLGLPGAGVSSACSNLFSVLAMSVIILATPGLRRFRITKRLLRPDWTRLKEIFHLGVPIGLTTIFEVMLFNSATLAMGLFGTASLAAHQIAITIPSITFMVPLGIGLAATVRVGLAAGAGDRIAARRAGFTAMAMATVFMAFSSVLLLSFPRVIAQAWLPGGNAQIIALAVVFLHVAAAFQIVDGIQVTAAMALRGLKDARAPMWIAGASYWLAGFPVCIALGFGLHWAGLGIWIGLAFGLLVAAITLGWRFAWLSRIRLAPAAP